MGLAFSAATAPRVGGVVSIPSSFPALCTPKCVSHVHGGKAAIAARVAAWATILHKHICTVNMRVSLMWLEFGYSQLQSHNEAGTKVGGTVEYGWMGAAL